ncbi:hypothetical protein [Nocardia sp. NPDC050435]|uniref:hypothetical protein n=1 Tax=Nocardia sp. NPDC050435 TaxID=3155040 RepID=UPI0033C1D497
MEAVPLPQALIDVYRQPIFYRGATHLSTIACPACDQTADFENDGAGHLRVREHNWPGTEAACPTSGVPVVDA